MNTFRKYTSIMLRNNRLGKSTRRLVFLGLLLLPLGGCTVVQSTLNASGPAAHRIETMQWWMLILFCVATLVMWILYAWAAKRRPGSLEDHAPSDASGGGQGWIVYGGLLIPLVILSALFAGGLVLMQSFPIHDPSHSDTPPNILVIGHQWWWEVRYLGKLCAGR